MDGTIDRLGRAGCHHQGVRVHAVGPAEHRVRRVVSGQHFTGQPSRYAQTHDLGRAAHGWPHAAARLARRQLDPWVAQANDDHRRIGELREIFPTASACASLSDPSTGTRMVLIISRSALGCSVDGRASPTWHAAHVIPDGCARSARERRHRLVTGPLEQYECNFAATMAKQQGDVGRYPAYDQRARRRVF
jgi:hypothetical protein